MIVEAWPNNLPLPLSSFVGRQHERDEVKRLLGDARLVTLTGAGGGGKTRLALRVAAEMCRHIPPQAFCADGVYFVDLAVVAHSSLVPQAVAAALGVSEQPRRALTDTLLDFLREKELLVVLDNASM